MTEQQNNIIKQYEGLVETMKSLALSLIQKDGATNTELEEASCILKQQPLFLWNAEKLHK